MSLTTRTRTIANQTMAAAPLPSLLPALPAPISPDVALVKTLSGHKRSVADMHAELDQARKKEADLSLQLTREWCHIEQLSSEIRATEPASSLDVTASDPHTDCSSCEGPLGPFRGPASHGMCLGPCGRWIHSTLECKRPGGLCIHCYDDWAAKTIRDNLSYVEVMELRADREAEGEKFCEIRLLAPRFIFSSEHVVCHDSPDCNCTDQQARYKAIENRRLREERRIHEEQVVEDLADRQQALEDAGHKRMKRVEETEADAAASLNLSEFFS